MNYEIPTTAIRGAYGLRNFGDDALMYAASEIVKRAFASEGSVFIGKDSAYIQEVVPGARVVAADSRAANDVDLVVYGGGTQFYSFPRTSQEGRIRALPGRIARNLRRPDQLLRKVIHRMSAGSRFVVSRPREAAIGIGLGPFVDNCRNMQRTKGLLLGMDYVSVRDIQSHELCKQWKCRNVSLGSDLCYLPGLWNVHASNPRMAGGASNIERVGIIARDWPHTYEGDSYADPLLQVVDDLRSAGKEVDFISFSDGYDRKWAARLERRNEQSKAWDPERCSISGFTELLSGYDAFITARYHGAVFASILGKPVVCIEVEQKLRCVSELLRDGARVWAYPFVSSECIEQISSIEGNYPAAVECLAGVVKEQNALAEKTLSEFRKSMTLAPRSDA